MRPGGGGGGGGNEEDGLKVLVSRSFRYSGAEPSGRLPSTVVKAKQFLVLLFESCYWLSFWTGIG